ncbi:hypothetical protein ABN117_04305 [Providencia manganoxydans]
MLYNNLLTILQDWRNWLNKLAMIIQSQVTGTVARVTAKEKESIFCI